MNFGRAKEMFFIMYIPVLSARFRKTGTSFQSETKRLVTFGSRVVRTLAVELTIVPFPFNSIPQNRNFIPI